jgi:DNA-binding GntR family transcriptional regulator
MAALVAPVAEALDRNKAPSFSILYMIAKNAAQPPICATAAFAAELRAAMTGSRGGGVAKDQVPMEFASSGEVAGTMSARIERAIRKDILSGAITPGERLRVAELSARYGVSHIPVRDALRQLEGDRLVIIESHKGAILRGVSRKFVADMHDTRAAIETLLVRNATLKATEAELEQLSRLALAYESAAAAQLAPAMVEANLQFHRFIARVADNPEAADILDRGWELVIGIRNRFGFGENRIAEIVAQHRAMVAAIRARDVQQAVTAAQEHCDSAKNDLLARMGQDGLGDAPAPRG